MQIDQKYFSVNLFTSSSALQKTMIPLLVVYTMINDYHIEDAIVYNKLVFHFGLVDESVYETEIGSWQQHR